MSARDFQEHRKFEKIFFSWPVFAIVVALTLSAFLGIIRAWQTRRALDLEIARLQAETAKAEEVRRQYEDQFKEIATQEGMDRQARARFNLKKPGEEVVLFVDNNQSSSIVPSGDETGLFSAVQSWIKNLFSW